MTMITKEASKIGTIYDCGMILRNKNKVDITNEIKNGQSACGRHWNFVYPSSFGLSTIPVCTEMILNTGVNISDNKIVRKNLITILKETSIWAPTLIKSHNYYKLLI